MEGGDASRGSESILPPGKCMIGKSVEIDFSCDVLKAWDADNGSVCAE